MLRICGVVFRRASFARASSCSRCCYCNFLSNSSLFLLHLGEGLLLLSDLPLQFFVGLVATTAASATTTPRSGCCASLPERFNLLSQLSDELVLRGLIHDGVVLDGLDLPGVS